MYWGFGTNADPAGMGRVVVRTVTGRLKTGHLWALQNRPLQDALPEFDLKSTHYSLVKAFKAWISL